MSVKNVCADDVALIELVKNGSTQAPAAVLERLRVRGRITLSAGVPSLTPKGRKRGAALLPMEHDLRLLCQTSAGRSPLTSPGGSSIHVGGGKARIN